MPKKKKGGMTKVYEQIHGIKYQPPVYSKEEVEQMSNDLKRKHKVSHARQEQARKKYYQKLSMLENAVTTHEARLEKAQRTLEKGDMYTLGGKVLLAIVLINICLAFVLLATMGTDSFIIMLAVSLVILALSIAVQFQPILAERILREDGKKLKAARSALYQMKNRH